MSIFGNRNRFSGKGIDYSFWCTACRQSGSVDFACCVGIRLGSGCGVGGDNSAVVRYWPQVHFEKTAHCIVDDRYEAVTVQNQ